MRYGKNLLDYVETALWSSVDDDGNPLDRKFSIDDIDEKALEKMQRDIDAFIEKAGPLLDDRYLENEHDSRIMHDFWLTRNRHGAGFWDGDYEERLGERLTEISRSFGECDLYVGDDGKIYLFGGES